MRRLFEIKASAFACRAASTDWGSSAMLRTIIAAVPARAGAARSSGMSARPSSRCFRCRSRIIIATDSCGWWESQSRACRPVWAIAQVNGCPFDKPRCRSVMPNSCASRALSSMISIIALPISIRMPLTQYTLHSDQTGCRFVATLSPLYPGMLLEIEWPRKHQ
jgi:hypothetical protein